MKTIEWLGVSKHFGAVTVIPDFSLAIAAGEFIALLGPSGCGKSTLLRMLAGLESVSAGRIRIDERDVTDLPPGQRGVAMVFQQYALYPHMSVRDNMAFGLRNIAMDAAQIERRVTEAAQMLELQALLERRPAQLSGGQRQRVAIGRAVVKEPAAFLFDEPLSNLDAALRSRTRVELARLHKRLKATMLFVTHDQVEAMTLADRIVVMNQGRIEQVAAPMALYDRPATRFVAGFVGSPAMNFIPVQRQADEDGQVAVALPDGGLVVANGSLHAEPALGDAIRLRPDLACAHLFDASGRLTGWLFVAPFLFCYGVLMLWPLLQGIWLSQHAVDLLSNIGSFVGLRNFIDLAQDEVAVRVFFNTLLFAAVCTPLMVASGLALALALNRPGRGAAVLRGIFFGASVLSVTVVTLVWRMVLLPETGLLSNLTSAAGIGGVAPLNSEWLALPTVALVTVWWCIGLPMMLFLAALQQVPPDVYEAAALDNASRWTTLRRITLPAIRRTVVLVAITQAIGQLQVFGQLQLLTQGGPNNSTRPMVMFIFEAMFDQWALGYAAAAAQVLFVLLLGCVALQQWFERRHPEQAV